MTQIFETHSSGDLDAHFSRRAFALRHSLAEHPLFGVERLIELSRALPPHRVEWNAGTLPLVNEPSSTPANGMSAEETIRRISDCGSWLVLKHVQQDPEYRALLDECIAELRPSLHRLGHRTFRHQAFIFLSSPGAVTPLHIDPENNFLLQIQGSKSVSVHDRTNREVVSDEDREQFAAGGHRNLSASEESLAAAHTHEIRPGDALHVPLHAPHFVRNGPEVSISFSVTFQTRSSDTEHGVLWINHKLRKAGVKPRPFGDSKAVDRVKHSVFSALRAVKRLKRKRA